jgi:DNA (cytosine-5)-methyltransferase 1
MWKHMARIIHEVRPKFVFVENSPNLTSRGLGVVLGDLATMGFDAKWGVLGAADVGAPHQRDRIWIFANSISNTNCESHAQRGSNNPISETCGHGDIDKNRGGKNVGSIIESTQNETLETKITTTIGNKNYWLYESGFPRVVDGVAARVDRLKAIGNGQVPKVAATAWKLLSERI